MPYLFTYYFSLRQKNKSFWILDNHKRVCYKIVSMFELFALLASLLKGLQLLFYKLPAEVKCYEAAFQKLNETELLGNFRKAWNSWYFFLPVLINHSSKPYKLFFQWGNTESGIRSVVRLRHIARPFNFYTHLFNMGHLWVKQVYFCSHFNC